MRNKEAVCLYIRNRKGKREFKESKSRPGICKEKKAMIN